MDKRAFIALLVAACGGQVVGPLIGDSGPQNDSGGPCTTNAGCPAGQMCGFDESLKCSATGKCFPSGVMCNSFQPGCSCAGQTINVACTGLPTGYAPAPVSEVGFPCATDGGSGPQFPCGSTFCNSGAQVCSNDMTCVASNGCTTCACAQALFQCTSTCKQINLAIYIQCQ